MFKVNFGNSMGAFGVPNEIVDHHLKLAGALSLKVLLVLLRSGEAMNIAQLSVFLNQSEVSIKDAINYWVQLNIVTERSSDNKQTNSVAENPIKPSKLESAFVPPIIEAAPLEVKPQVIPKERFYRMTRHDVNAISQTDDNIGVLIEQSQNILSRPLSSGESETIVSFYHHYGMGVDVILMLLGYAKSIDKDSPAYYEKIALDWINREINTHEKADKELMRLTQVVSEEKELRNIFGIYDRRITKKEMEFFNCWKSEYNMDKNMVQLAYERNINAKGSYSFHYVNAILKSWFQKGIKTPFDAETDDNSEKTRNKQTQTNSNSSYNLNELNDIIAKGNVWD